MRDSILRRNGRASGQFKEIRATARHLAAAASVLLGAWIALAAAAPAPQRAAETGRQQTSSSPAAIERGRRIFASTCAGCHGLDGHGGERAPDILARPELQRMSELEIARVISHGTASMRMPPFIEILSAAQIRSAAAYVHGLAHGNSHPAPMAGDPAAGKALFFGKAGCGDCHMAGGAGGFLGPDLTAYAESHSAAEIHDAITNPAKDSGRIEKQVAVVTREGEQIAGIVRNEDNFSLQVQTPDGAFHLLSRADLEKITYAQQPLMPSDYSRKLSAKELDDLTAFLWQTATANTKSQPSGPQTASPDEDR